VVPGDENRPRAGVETGLAEAGQRAVDGVGDAGELVEYVAGDHHRLGVERGQQRVESLPEITRFPERELHVGGLTAADVEVGDHECLGTPKEHRTVPEDGVAHDIGSGRRRLVAVATKCNLTRI
jgi:hypothetical protein